MLSSLTAWFLVGLAAGSYVQWFPILILLGLVLLAFGLAWRERHGGLPGSSGMSSYAAVLAGVVYWPVHTLALAPAASLPVDPSETTTLTGRIVAPVRVSPDRLRLLVEPGFGIDSIEPPPVAGKIRLTWRNPDRPLYEGDLIAFSARLHAPLGTHNPGGFDFGSYLRRQGIAAVGTLSGAEQVEVVASGRSSWRWTLWSHLDGWRQDIVRAASASLDPRLAAVFVGLVTGDQGLIDQETREDFVATGTVHILSISGSHLGLLAILTFVTGRLACRWLPVAALLRLNRANLTPTRLAALVTVPLVTGYALLAGAEVATIRSLWMILLWLVALWLGRDKGLTTMLAAAALLTLLLDPQTLYDVSFQLSYGSVLAMALYLDAGHVPELPLGKPEPRSLGTRAWIWTRETAVLSLLVTGVTLPVVAAQFHQLPWIGPFANLLLIPLAAVLVPMSLLSACWLLIAQSEVLPLAPMVEWWLSALTGIVAWLAQWPAVNWHVAAPSVLTVLAYYAVVGVAASDRHRWRRLAAIGCLGILLCWWIFPHRTLPPDSVRITMLDVGQGDATLVELPGGETVLIDGGARYERYDVGASVVGPMLWDQGIVKIDHVIGTHPQLDHVGGLPWVLRHFAVDHYWGNAMAREEAFYRDLQRVLAERHLDEQQPSAGQLLAVSGPCRLTALNAFPTLEPAARTVGRPAGGSALNNASVITRLDCAPHAVLFAGDTEAGGLRHLVSDGSDTGVTILKVPHHGARSSLYRPWIQAMHPQVAVISVGPHNPYHHPHPDVVAAYEAVGASLFRTDRDGAVTITASLRDSSFTVATVRQLDFELVALSDAPWASERRNIDRLCRRTFDRACSQLF